MNKQDMLAAMAAATVLLAAGCASAPGATAHPARSAVSALTADPAYRADKQRLEGELLASFQKDFRPSHPITSMMSAVQATFPDGAGVVNFAVRTFTLADAHGPALHAWAAGVVTFALAQGQPAVAGTPSIPGVTPPATTHSP